MFNRVDQSEKSINATYELDINLQQKFLSLCESSHLQRSYCHQRLPIPQRAERPPSTYQSRRVRSAIAKKRGQIAGS